MGKAVQPCYYQGDSEKTARNHLTVPNNRRTECFNCEIKSRQMAKILKVLSQTLVFLGEAKKWRRDEEETETADKLLVPGDEITVSPR